MIKYSIRPYRSGDEYDIVELLQTVFLAWPRFNIPCSSIDHWRWKFIDNPSNETYVYVAESDSKIVGTESRILLKIKVLDNILLGEQRVDLGVHPDFRGQGIFSNILESLYKNSLNSNIQLSYAEESNPIVIKKWKKYNAALHPNRIIKYFWIRDLVKFKENNKSIDLSLYKDLQEHNFYFNERKFDESWNIIEIDRFEKNIDLFWNKASKSFDYILKRDQYFLNWRYCDPRGGSFIKKVAVESGEIIGFIVYRFNTWFDDYPKGLIYDFLTLPNRNDVAKSLLYDAIKYFSDVNVYEINYWAVEESPYNKIFEELGFVDLNQNIYLNFIPINIKKEIFKKLLGKKIKIYFSMGDVD